MKIRVHAWSEATRCASTKEPTTPWVCTPTTLKKGGKNTSNKFSKSLSLGDSSSSLRAIGRKTNWKLNSALVRAPFSKKCFWESSRRFNLLLSILYFQVFDVYEVLPTPKFQFGGVVGNMVSSVVFIKRGPASSWRHNQPQFSLLSVVKIFWEIKY